MAVITKFKDTIGRWYTVALFKEFAPDKKHVLFTTEEAKQLYLECNDITGYEFATKHLGGWQHWVALHNSPKVLPLIEQWEEELEVRIRSESIKNIALLSKGEKGYQAAKFLADKGWKVKGVGRTTKEAIDKEAKIQSKLYDEFKGNVIELKRE